MSICFLHFSLVHNVYRTCASFIHSWQVGTRDRITVVWSELIFTPKIFLLEILFFRNIEILSFRNHLLRLYFSILLHHTTRITIFRLEFTLLIDSITFLWVVLVPHGSSSVTRILCYIQTYTSWIIILANRKMQDQRFCFVKHDLKRVL